MSKNEMPAGAVFVALIVVVAAIVYLPLLSIWCINTLVVVPCHGDEIPYALFTKYWWAALFCSGVLGILGASSGGAKAIQQ
jgi:hypothetical protein